MKYIIFLLSLVGLSISSYLAYEYTNSAVIGCPVGGVACDVVRNSPYSKIFGISVPYWGIAYYLTLAIWSVLILEKDSKFFRKIGFGLSVVGFITSLYFTYLEAFVIHAFCFWCVLSALTSTILLALFTRFYIILPNENRD